MRKKGGISQLHQLRTMLICFTRLASPPKQTRPQTTYAETYVGFSVLAIWGWRQRVRGAPLLQIDRLWNHLPGCCVDRRNTAGLSVPPSQRGEHVLLLQVFGFLPFTFRLFELDLDLF